MSRTSRCLVVLGSLLLALGLVAGVVNRQVLDGDRFARHVDAVRADPQVARQVGLVVSDQLLTQQPDLVGLRPLIESASTALVASPALGPVVRSAVVPLHRALTSSDGDQVVLRLADVGALLVAAITTLAPQSSAQIPADLDVTLASIGGQRATADLIGMAHTVGLLAWLLPLLGLVVLGAAAMIGASGRRHRARVVATGVLLSAAMLTAALVVVDLLVGRLDAGTLGGALGQGVWRELDGGFWIAVGLFGSIGFVGRVMTSEEFSLDLSTMATQGWQRATATGGAPVAEAMRGALLLVAGVFLVLRPSFVLALATVVLGVLLVLSGGHALWRVATQAWVVRAPARAASVRALVRRSTSMGPVLGAIAVVAVLLPGAWPADRDLAVAATAADDGTCNGHAELCGRRYDEVAFAATHNSMSAADQPGWFLAEQPHGVMRQLDDGIRVLLIDSWNGQQSQRPGVIANTEESRAKALAEAEDAYGADVVSSALRIRDALDLTPTGPAKPYLCHALCELGSTEWEPLMVDVRTWLDQHPREVLTFFVQDEVSPADTAALVERAGLTPYVYTPRPGEPFPTLGEMISSGHRVVFLLEHTGGGTADPWLIDGRDAVQDTPYAFTKTSQFSCDLFRGTADAPLFLVNHWLSNFDSRVTDARRVNASSVLLPRLEQCRTERDHIPNFVAVDNYDQGDLLGVVDALNGVG